MVKFLKFLFLAITTLSVLFSCSQDSEQNTNSEKTLTEEIKGTWTIGGFRVGEGFEYLDSTQKLQLQFQLMQYQMLNIKYVFGDQEYKIFILNDSLYDGGKMEIRDSVVTFHSEYLGRTDSYKIVRLEGDTLEFTAAEVPPPNTKIVTVNLVLVRHSDTSKES